MTSEGLKSLVHKVQEFPYIRRPRQTQGGARQGIIHWTFFFERKSEVTLGIFEVQFRSFSVLHCHGDLPLGVVRF